MLIVQGAVLLNELISIIEDIKMIEEVAVYGAVWLNRVSEQACILAQDLNVTVYQTSSFDGDFASCYLANLTEKGIKIENFERKGIIDLPECGENELVLKHHGLSAADILKSLR